MRPPARAIANWWRCSWTRARIPNVATTPAPAPSRMPLADAMRSRGFRAIAQMLILHGARVDQADPATGSTPLNEAARKGHRELVALLLDKGADPKRRDNSGASPIENAATF